MQGAVVNLPTLNSNDFTSFDKHSQNTAYSLILLMPDARLLFAPVRPRTRPERLYNILETLLHDPYHIARTRADSTRT